MRFSFWSRVLLISWIDWRWRGGLELGLSWGFVWRVGWRVGSFSWIE